MDYGASMARSDFCALAAGTGNPAAADSRGPCTGHMEWRSVAWRCAFSHDGSPAARDACNPWVLGISGAECAHLCDAGGKPGVWFFSLDAANSAAVAGARLWFHLPYFRAEMKLVKKGEWIFYDSRRTHKGAGSANLEARYRPTGPAFEAKPGSLDHWLTERYCLYAADSSQRIYRAEIHHQPWPLQPVEAEFALDTMTVPLGLPLPGTAPLLHFAQIQDVRVWQPRLAATPN